MSEITGDTDLSLMASTEIMQLTDLAIDGQSSDYFAFVKNQLGSVVTQLGMARGEHAKLSADDQMNPIGRERRLSELPDRIDAGTGDVLNNIDTAIAVLEAHLRSQALAHDGSNDVALRQELQNYSTGLNRDTAMGALIPLAADSRYSTLLAGSYGKSLAARFGIDHSAFTRAALQSLATNGTPIQVRAIAGLNKIPAARRAHFLARSEAQKVSGKFRAASAARPAPNFDGRAQRYPRAGA